MKSVIYSVLDATFFIHDYIVMVFSIGLFKVNEATLFFNKLSSSIVHYNYSLLFNQWCDFSLSVYKEDPKQTKHTLT